VIDATFGSFATSWPLIKSIHHCLPRFFKFWRASLLASAFETKTFEEMIAEQSSAQLRQGVENVIGKSLKYAKLIAAEGGDGPYPDRDMADSVIPLVKRQYPKHKRRKGKSNYESNHKAPREIGTSHHIGRRFELHERVCEVIGGISTVAIAVTWFSNHRVGFAWAAVTTISAALYALCFWFTDHENKRVSASEPFRQSQGILNAAFCRVALPMPAEASAIRYETRGTVCGEVLVAEREESFVTSSDLEYGPNDYPIPLEPILSGDADAVFGSRFLGSRPHRVLYFWHMVGNRFLTLLSNMFTNLNLTDIETCYKVFRAPLIKSLHLREDRFGFEAEVTAKLAKAGCRIYEVGISYSGRTYEEGKKVNWKDGVRAIYAILRYNLFP
jgi:hypothetical protein